MRQNIQRRAGGGGHAKEITALTRESAGVNWSFPLGIGHSGNMVFMGARGDMGSLRTPDCERSDTPSPLLREEDAIADFGRIMCVCEGYVLPFPATRVNQGEGERRMGTFPLCSGIRTRERRPTMTCFCSREVREEERDDALGVIPNTVRREWEARERGEGLTKVGVIIT